MKIYRYVANGRDFASIRITKSLKWWPDGIDLGKWMERTVPRRWDATDKKWLLEDGHYDQAPEEYPLSDFVFLTLNVPVVSERAESVLRREKMVSSSVRVTIGPRETPCYVAQPLVQDGVPLASSPLVVEHSRGLQMPNGETFYYYQRFFDSTRVPGELFGLPEHAPYSDLYVTERFVELARAEGLTGLECIELVWDDAPVIPRYTPPPAEVPWSAFRLEHEFWLTCKRCDPLLYSADDVRPVFERALRDGYLGWNFDPPRYERSSG